MSRAPLIERLEAHLAAAQLLEGPAEVLVAVSGGSDSLALLDLLSGVATNRGLTLCVVHADHGIHKESARVAEQVTRIAKDRYGVFTIVRPLALGADASETRARTARYRFFREVQRARGARWLATAHHADDQVETVLLRLLRGSGPAGLAGIPQSGPDGLVRPLLPFRRAELAEHVHAAGLPVFDDPTNRDPRHTRSWVRESLLPVLETRLGAEAVDSLLSVQHHAALDVAAWDEVLDALGTLDVRAADGRIDVARTALGGYDAVLAARLLRAAARRAGIVLGPAQSERLARFAKDAASGRRFAVGDGLAAEAAFERLIVWREANAPEAFSVEGEEGAGQFGGFEVRWRSEPVPERLERGGWTTWIEDGPLTVRGPEPGDRLAPLGGVGHRSVSRLLMEARVGRVDRGSHPVVVRDGEPVWIPGVCRGDAAVPAPGTLAVRMDVAAR